MNPRSWDVLQGNGYAFSAKAASDFTVYSCVFLSFACMSKTRDFPVLQISSYDLRVTRQNIERYLG